MNGVDSPGCVLFHRPRACQLEGLTVLGYPGLGHALLLVFAGPGLVNADVCFH